MGRDATPVLKGVKCIVDVRMSAGDADVDCSAAVSEKLVHLGAKVVKRLGRDTTHVVWLNGNRNVREDTLKRSEVKLVGPLWVEACLQTATRVPETKFFPSDTPANQSTPLPSPAAEKKKRRRSSLMEPRREDVFDELTTPIKKTRRQTLDAVTPMAITLTPQEGVSARSLSLRRRSRSPEYDDISQPTEASTNLSTVDEVAEPPSQSDTHSSRQSVGSNHAAATTPAKPTTSPAKTVVKSLCTPASSVQATSAHRATPKHTKNPPRTWPCVSCTFENPRVAKRCKMCGTSSTGVEPSQLLVGSIAKKHDDISSRSNKPATRLATKQPPPVEPNTPTPQVSLPRKKQPSTTPIGTPKQGHHPPTPPRRGNTSSLKSIPVVKVATPVKAKVKAAKPSAARTSKKEGTSTDVAPKQTAVKRKAAAVEHPRVLVKPKVSHTPPAPTKKSEATTSKAPATAMNQSTTTKTKRMPRYVISVSGANLDTRLVLESSMREIDASSPGDGKSRIVDEFGAAAAVTHVVVSDKSKRTMKVLFGLATGAYIVSDAWVFSSLEAKMWLDESPFLMTEYPAVSKKKTPPNLLDGIKIYVASGLDPPKATLQALILAAGGHPCSQMALADVCMGVEPAVGRRASLAGLPMVSPKWLFDSLASGVLGQMDHHHPVVTDS
ncbi:hypothetical protein H257_05092 [Aphanomyces astaci]|uniref:RanBP2-type domain-containing protein n=1 Tax=Aphanomyces astaci TaxID=112090 RepID=W4GU77_APHAT|nr:hypothetical protein H257_05092 [Aphanomyces astaci]ETV82463.1 hypothetical protein H257_05092 [Aphanomyces astaci]|eukprot:XP_009828132.1 hypothetical protein H257_05092 [Aphanomyces astaci]